MAKLGGTKCARGRRTVKAGVVRKNKGEKKDSLEGCSREEIYQVRIIILFPNQNLSVSTKSFLKLESYPIRHPLHF